MRWIWKLIILIFVIISNVQCLMVRQNRNASGTTGQDSDFFVFRGKNITVPCHYKRPYNKEEEKSAIWEIPDNIIHKFETADNLARLINPDLIDSTTIHCTDIDNVKHTSRILVVEIPLTARIEYSVDFSADSLETCEDQGEIVRQTLEEMLCRYEQLLRDNNCLIVLKSRCETQAITSWPYKLTLTSVIDVPNFIDYEDIALVACLTQDRCAVLCQQDFDCIHNHRYSTYLEVMAFLRARLVGIIEKWKQESLSILYGMQWEQELAEPEYKIITRCPNPGFMLLADVLCIPCKPGTYNELTQVGAGTPATCKPCSAAKYFMQSACNNRKPSEPPKPDYVDLAPWKIVPYGWDFTTWLTMVRTRPVATTTPIPKSTTPEKFGQLVEEDRRLSAKTIIGIVIAWGIGSLLIMLLIFNWERIHRFVLNQIEAAERKELEDKFEKMRLLKGKLLKLEVEKKKKRLQKREKLMKLKAKYKAEKLKKAQEQAQGGNGPEVKDETKAPTAKGDVKALVKDNTKKDEAKGKSEKDNKKGPSKKNDILGGNIKDKLKDLKKDKLSKLNKDQLKALKAKLERKKKAGDIKGKKGK